MKRIEYDRYGGPETMRVAAFEAPALGADDILLKVEAASVNPVDWGIRRGQMKLLTGPGFPRTMGKDVAGTILEVGTGVTGWKPGDAVFGCVPWRRTGSFASVARVRAKDIVRKPEAMSFAHAAALPTVGLTAWHGLVDRARLESGQAVLINGAAGGVGIAAIQIARSRGAVITARVGRRSFDRMRELGVNEVLDYRDPVPSALDRRFDAVLDCNGSLEGPDIDRILKRSGTAVDITFHRDKVMRSAFLCRQKLASGSVDQKTLLALSELAQNGVLLPDIGAQVVIDEAIPLITRLEKGERLDGKAVILLD